MRITPLAIYTLDVQNIDEYFEIIKADTSFTHPDKNV